MGTDTGEKRRGGDGNKEWAAPRITTGQCFGSGSALDPYSASPGIRIRNLYFECGSRIQKLILIFTVLA